MYGIIVITDKNCLRAITINGIFCYENDRESRLLFVIRLYLEDILNGLDQQYLSPIRIICILNRQYEVSQSNIRLSTCDIVIRY